jgi:hypothetical protein
MDMSDTFVLETRTGEHIDTLGGEESTALAYKSLAALLDGPDGKNVELSDSYWPLAAASSGLGLFFLAFGAAAIRDSRQSVGEVHFGSGSLACAWICWQSLGTR